MAETKTAGQKLKDELLMNDKNGWEELSEKEKKEILSFNDGYINFLNKGKTERECVKEAKEIAEANGFKEISKVKKLKAGDKVYEINRGKNIVLAVIGEEPIENGMKVNNSPKAQEEKIVENLKYSEFSMDSKNGESNFRVRVTNVGKEKTEEQYVKVTCLDVNGKLIGEIYLLVSELKPGESISATANIADDYRNLYDYEISK